MEPGHVSELVAQRFEVKLSEVTVGRYLRELSLSPQVPDWKAREQDPEQVRRFLYGRAKIKRH